MDNIKKFTAEENADRFFTKYSEEQCKNDSQMLSSTQYHERLTETFKEYEKEIETLSNICDSERAKIERLKTVGSEISNERDDLKEKVCDLELKLEEKTKSANDWCKKAMEKHDQFLAVKSKSTQIAIEFADWIHNGNWRATNKSGTRQTLSTKELFQEFLKEKEK